MVPFSHRGFYKSEESSGEELVELHQLPFQQHALQTYNELITAPITPLCLTHSALLLSLTLVDSNDGKTLNPTVLEAAYMR